MKIEEWANLLWAHIEGTYHPGVPLYLCADELLLSTLANSFDPTLNYDPKTAEIDFIEACNSKIWHVGNQFHLEREIFEQETNGRSLVICYAVQQVLAAEKMIDDDMGSSDSFYVRYWQILDPEANAEHRSPILYIHFHNIWKIIKNEILALPNATPSLISFEEGKGSKDKFRALPISQALLNHEALTHIVGQIPNIESLSDASLIHRIRRISNTLKKQARKKVYLDAIEQPILQQVRAYEKKYTVNPYVKATKTIRDPDSTLRAENYFAYIDDDGWDEVIRLGFREPDNVEKQNTNLERSLNEYLDKNTALAFAGAEYSDYLGETLQQAQASKNIELLVYRKRDEAKIPPLLGSNWKEICKPAANNLSDEFFVQLFPGADLEVWFDQETDIESSQNIRHRPYLAGGIMIDQRKNFYLVGYPPLQLECSERKVDSNKIIKVNGVTVRCSDFFNRLSAERNPKDYLIEIDNFDLRFSLVAHREDENQFNIGYKVVKGYLANTGSLVEEFEPHIRHLTQYNFVLSDMLLCQKILDSDLSRHFRISHKRWRKCSNSSSRLVGSLVDDNLEPSPQKAFYLHQIITQRKIPPTIFSMLRKFGVDRN